MQPGDVPDSAAQLSDIAAQQEHVNVTRCPSRAEVQDHGCAANHDDVARHSQAHIHFL